MTDPISNERLLPCPFCGLDEAYIADTMPGGAYWCVCGHCGTETQSSQRQSEAIAAWNRRQSPAGVEPEWFAVQSASGAHVGMWRDERIARRVFDQEYPDGEFIPLYASPPKAVTITDEMVERAAEAIAESWGETWHCDCSENRGLDCDCGVTITDESEPYDERLSREDCRMASRAALTAALSSEAHNGREGE